MNKKAKNKSVPCFDMQFITSSISTTLVLLLLGLVVFFVLGAHNLSVYVKENINFSILISDDMKESDILKLQKKLDKEPFVKETEYISKSRRSASRPKQWEQTRRSFSAITLLRRPLKLNCIPVTPIRTASPR